MRAWPISLWEGNINNEVIARGKEDMWLFNAYLRMKCMVSFRLDAWKGRDPVNISNISTPKDHQSAVVLWPFLLTTLKWDNETGSFLCFLEGGDWGILRIREQNKITIYLPQEPYIQQCHKMKMSYFHLHSPNLPCRAQNLSALCGRQRRAKYWGIQQWKCDPKNKTSGLGACR